MDLIKTLVSVSLLGFLANEDLKSREMHDLPLFAYALINPTITLVEILQNGLNFWKSLGLAISVIIVVAFAVLYLIGAVANGDLLMSIGLYLGHPWLSGRDVLPFPLLVMSLSLVCLLVHAAFVGKLMFGKKVSVEEAKNMWRDRYVIVLPDGRMGGLELLEGAGGVVKILDPPPFVFHSYLGFLLGLAVNLITRMFR